jgi:hypothetical protein
MSKELTIKIKIEGKEVELTSKQLELFKKNADNLKKSLDELGERTEENAEQFDKLKGDLESLESVFGETKDSINENTESLEDNAKASETVRKQITDLRNQLQALGPRTAENASQFDTLTGRLIELQEVQEEVELGTRKLDDALTQVPGPIGQAASIFKVYDTTLKNVRAAKIALIKQFPILKSAIAATGIGALVILFGLLVSAVTKAFKTFEPLQQAVGKLGTLMDVLGDAIQPVIDLIGRGLTVALEGLARALAFVTGQTESYNQALRDKQALEQFNASIEQQRFQLEILGDTYEEFERRRIESRLESQERIKEINESETLNEQEKARRILLIEQRLQRDLKKVDLDKATREKEEREKRIEERKKESDRLLQIEIDRINKERDLLNQQADAIRSAADVYISAISDLQSKQAQIREIQYIREVQQLTEFLEKAELTSQQSLAIRLRLFQKYQRDLQKIQDESELKRIQQEISSFNASIRNLERYRIATETELLEIVQAYDSTTGFADVFLGKLSKRMSDLMMMEFDRLRDLRDVYKEQYDLIASTIEEESRLLEESFEEKLISEQLYYSEVERLQQEAVENRARYVQQQIQLDRLEVQSRRESADETARIAENLGGFLAQIAGESTGLQIASALTDAAISIARIITDTQRAIIAFTAAVAPLGPAGIPIAAGYATKAKISAALGIATITAGTIGKLKGLKGQAQSQASGGGQSNGLGRGYADGGLVLGAGTSRSDSIPANLSNGEFVMNASSTSMFLPMLEMLNNAGRQTSVPTLRTTLSDSPQDTNKSSEMIIKTYVVESDLTSSQHQQARLKNLSTL